MFWALLVSPFILLMLAAIVARKGLVVRFALALGSIFLVIDGIAFWSLLSEQQSSTGSIGLAVIALLELAVAVVLLIASPFARKAMARNENNRGRSK